MVLLGLFAWGGCLCVVFAACFGLCVFCWFRFLGDFVGCWFAMVFSVLTGCVFCLVCCAR